MVCSFGLIVVSGTIKRSRTGLGGGCVCLRGLGGGERRGRATRDPEAVLDVCTG